MAEDRNPIRSRRSRPISSRASAAARATPRRRWSGATAPGLLYLLKRRTRDPELALDLRQDTFRVAIEKLRGSRLDEPERLAAYLRGVALNLLIAQQRKDTPRS